MKTSYTIIEHHTTQYGSVVAIMETETPSAWWDTLRRKKETKKVFEIFYPIKNTVKYFTSMSLYPSGKEVPLRVWKIVKSLLEIEQMEEETLQIEQTTKELDARN